MVDKKYGIIQVENSIWQQVTNIIYLVYKTMLPVQLDTMNTANLLTASIEIPTPSQISLLITLSLLLHFGNL